MVITNTLNDEMANDSTTWAHTTTDQLFYAEQYRPVIVAYKNGAPVRLGDIAEVESSVEDVRTGGISDGKRAVVLVLFRQPGANIIETVDRVVGMFPELRASIPPAMSLAVVVDRSTSIRASFRDVQITLGIAIV